MTSSESQPPPPTPWARGTIVVADDDATTRAILAQILRREHYRVIDVENGQLACEAVWRENPDLVLLDWSMPVMDGLTALKLLKSDSATRVIPVVMLTTQDQIEEKLLALEAGVQDFLVKPCHPRELVARLDQQRRWRDVLTTDVSAMAAERETATFELQAEESLRIAAEIERLRETATRDALTGLPNRLLFNDRMDQTILSSKRRKEHFATFYLDLDGFKEINDGHGHFAGDAVLKAVAARIQHIIRESDTVARFGGDEFVVVAPRILTPQDARDIAERMVEAVCTPISVGDFTVCVSASIGVSFYPIDASDRRGLIGCADTAMYVSKRAGKNRFTFANEDVLHDAQLWDSAFVDSGAAERNAKVI